MDDLALRRRCIVCLGIFAICRLDAAAANSASGSRNHRAALYCRQADFAAAGFCVSAWLALVFQRGYLLYSGVICNPQERNSVIALDYRSHAGRARGELSAELPAARVRRTAADYASTCKSVGAPLNGLFRCPINSGILVP